MASGKIHILTKSSDKVIHEQSNMNRMYWNHALEKHAQDWANELDKECRFGHNTKNRYVTIEGIPVGENISKDVSNLKKDTNHLDDAVAKAIKKWWAEKDLMDIDRIKKDIKSYKFGYQTGHFTQMAWAETSQIGCGYALYTDSRYRTDEVIVCNFAVVGNQIDRSMNVEGKPCSKCIDNKTCSKEYPGLCGKDNMIYDDEKVRAISEKDQMEIKEWDN